MSKRRITDSEGLAAIESNNQATAVRYLLQQIESKHPGGSIELRVPPFGAVQILDGQNHRRGTPPNVVEISPETFLALALGERNFENLLVSDRVTLSGERAEEVRAVFPV